MHNSSLVTADRATHLKIVVLSLVCATVVACIGIAGRLGESTQGRMEATVLVPSAPLTATNALDHTIR